MIRRRIILVVSLLSPLLFAALLVSWVRSYYDSDVWAIRHGRRDGGGPVVTHSAMLMSGAGCIGVRAGRWSEPDSSALRKEFPNGLSGVHEAHPLPATGYPLVGSFWNRIGFHFAIDRFSGPADTEAAFTLVVPHWLPLWLSAAPTALWLMRRRRDRLCRRFGLCVGCGYDIRATPDRCPECGRIAAA
jgi:hypothetical protein